MVQYRRVIKASNLPVRLPLTSTVVAYLLLERLNAVWWVWLVVAWLYGLYWLGTLVALIAQRPVDMFEERCRVAGNTSPRSIDSIPEDTP